MAGRKASPTTRYEEKSLMKFRSARHILSFTLLATSIFSSAKSPDQADSWSVLNKITHKRTYTIETRDRKCTWGRITEVTPDRLTVTANNPKSYSPATVIFPRSDVLRVAAGRRVYYSGRSSWVDVSSIRVEGRERLKIVTTVGKTYEAKLPYTVSDDSVTLPAPAKATKISKSDIALVYDIVVKPLTDTGEYLQDELGPMIIFDPYLYEYGLHLEQYVSVLLYKADDPEDNSPAQCAQR
jgi:hypothetical protein